MHWEILMVYIQRLFSCLQCVVPDLSYTVRSPMLDTWEGIKQLKAALWALVVLTPNLHHFIYLSKRCIYCCFYFLHRATLALQTGVWISCRRRMSFLTSLHWLSTVRCCQCEGKCLFILLIMKFTELEKGSILIKICILLVEEMFYGLINVCIQSGTKWQD